jgi:hypothetical protein
MKKQSLYGLFARYNCLNFASFRLITINTQAAKGCIFGS